MYDKPLMRRHEPKVDQGFVYGFQMSWNPDDNSFYVEDGDEVLFISKDWNEAVAFAKEKTAAL